jgi:hypothetical protein
VSISAINAVWKLTSLPGLDKSVLLALADYANADGLCWPSVETLARKSAWSERAVQDAIRRLVEKRFLVVEIGIKRGRQTVNRYTVLPGQEEFVRGAGDAPLNGSRGAAGASRGAGGSPLRGAAGSPPLNLEPSENESPREPRTVKSIEDDRQTLTVWRGELPKVFREGFDDFYRTYPNKKNPGRAERAYFFARKKATWAEIMEGLKRAIESDEWARVPKDGGSIVPHPATWLNARGWENQYTKKLDGDGIGEGFRKFLENKGGA